MPYKVRDGNGNVIGGDNAIAAGAFTATGASDAVKAKSVLVSIHIYGTFVASVDFEKSFDGGATWVLVKQYTAISSEIYEEVETDVSFRLNCSAFTSGTANYRLSAKG